MIPSSSALYQILYFLEYRLIFLSFFFLKKYAVRENFEGRKGKRHRSRITFPYLDIDVSIEEPRGRNQKPWPIDRIILLKRREPLQPIEPVGNGIRERKRGREGEGEAWVACREIGQEPLRRPAAIGSPQWPVRGGHP